MKHSFPYIVCIKISVLLCVAVLLGACGDKRSLRFSASLPDEFAIVTLRPLTLPPDYTITPPDRQSESELSVSKLQEEVRASLLLKASHGSPLVSDDQEFLRAAGADKRKKDIRRLLEEENLQAISEPLSVAEAIALEESFDKTTRVFFLTKRKPPKIKKIE